MRKVTLRDSNICIRSRGKGGSIKSLLAYSELGGHLITFWRESEIRSALNKTQDSTLKLERIMIRKGSSFPVEGSLLLIGRKPLSAS
jgi:hypothetical protein